MQTPGGIYAAVMAAGESTRFGETKQLVDIAGESLVRRACRVAVSVCGPRTLLVTGHDWRKVLISSGHHFFIVNDDYRSGLGSSIAAASKALRHTASSLLITHADQVRVTAGDLSRLVALHELRPSGISISRYGDTLGPPVIFPANALAELASLSGQDGARSVIRSGSYAVATLDCDNALFDIDRRADLRAFEQHSRQNDEN